METAKTDFEAEGACDTLIRAEEIRNKPALFKKAMAIMEKRKKAMMEAMDKNTSSFLEKRK